MWQFNWILAKISMNLLLKSRLLVSSDVYEHIHLKQIRFSSLKTGVTINTATTIIHH